MNAFASNPKKLQIMQALKPDDKPRLFQFAKIFCQMSQLMKITF
jgi:hypothetical protein